MLSWEVEGAAWMAEAGLLFGHASSVKSVSTCISLYDAGSFSKAA